MPTIRHRRPLAVGTLAIVLAAFPLGTLASHDFADVPDSNAFHADISALAASGVTTGCGGGNFCPSAFVTREQMAAFMNRLGALAAGKTPVVNAAELGGLAPGQFVRSDVAVTRNWSCAGPAMSPGGSAAVWLAGSGSIYALEGTSTTVRCQVHLPHGATVEGVSFAVIDDSPTESVSCRLQAALLDALGASFFGSGAASGVAAVPGTVTMQEAVSFTVDNVNRAYYATCVISGAGTDVRVRGIALEYSYAGLP